MHTVILLIGAFMTLLLVGVARRGGLMAAWVATAGTAVPMFLLYLAFRNDSEVAYLFPAFVLLTVTLLKAGIQLLGLRAQTPRSLDNMPAQGQPHWAA